MQYIVLSIEQKLAGEKFDISVNGWIFLDPYYGFASGSRTEKLEKLPGQAATNGTQVTLVDMPKRQTFAEAIKPLAYVAGDQQIERSVVPRETDFGRYHALVIGNNEHRSLNSLRTAVRDAEIVGKLLQNSYGFETSVLTNSSRGQILDSLDRLRKQLTKNDNLLIYYAGHGSLDEGAGRGYWLPVDAHPDRRSTWLSNADITDTLKAIRAKHVMVVVDSCYSGTLTRSTPRGVKVEPRTQDFITRMLTKKSRTVLASGGLEPVIDSGGSGHSVFAKAFLDALRENKGVIDGTQVFAYVRQQVRLNAPQTPEYANIRYAGHEVGGDFLFVRRR